MNGGVKETLENDRSVGGFRSRDPHSKLFYAS